MGTYSVLLIDGALTDEQQALLRRSQRRIRLESSSERYSRYEAEVPLTAADGTFWILETDVNDGARHWEFLRNEFVDPIREMVPDAAVYLTLDYMLHEHGWTRAQWLDIAEGRRPEIHSSWVELLTDEAITKWDLAAVNAKIERADGFLSHQLGTPTAFAAKSGDEWAQVIRKVLGALDDA